MIKVTLIAKGGNEHATIQDLADATVDLEALGFSKSDRLIVNKANGEFIFTQEFRRGYDGNHSLAGIQNYQQPQEVRHTIP